MVKYQLILFKIMIKILVRILNRFFKLGLYRVQPITRFQLLSEALNRQHRPIKFVQIGANDGISFDDLYLTVTSGRWSGIVVEPLKDLFDRLSFNYQDYPQVVPVNVAVHPNKEFETMYRVNKNCLKNYPSWAAGIASMSKSHLLKNNILENDILSENVICRSMMGLLREHCCIDADVLQIDTEGFDGEILKMIDFTEFRPIVVKFEWMCLSKDDQIKVRKILENSGYIFRVESDGADGVAWLKNSISP